MAAKVLSVALVALLAYQVSAAPFLFSGSISTDTPAVPAAPRQGPITGFLRSLTAPSGVDARVNGNLNLPSVGLPKVDLQLPKVDLTVPKIDLPKIDIPDVKLNGELDVDLDLKLGGDGSFLQRTASAATDALGKNILHSTNIATGGVTIGEGLLKTGSDVATGLSRHANKLGADVIQKGVDAGKSGADIGNINAKLGINVVADGMSTGLEGMRRWGQRVNDWRARARDFGNRAYNGAIDLAQGGVRAGAQLAANVEDAKTRLIHGGLNGVGNLSAGLRDNIDAGLANGNTNIQANLGNAAAGLRGGLSYTGGLAGGIMRDVSERIGDLSNANGSASFSLTV